MSEQELPQECCETCRFWDQIGKANFVDEVDKTDVLSWSQCQRFPPVSPVGNTLFWQRHDPHQEVQFPLTRDFDWCGEFQPRQDNPA